MFVWPHLKKAGWKRKRPTGRVGRFVVNGRGGQPGPPPHRSSLAPGRRMMIVSDTGPTGFEPAVSGLTGRCVKPGYTTAPTALIIPQSAFFVKRPLVASAAPIFGPGCLVGQLRAVVLPDQTEKKEAFCGGEAAAKTPLLFSAKGRRKVIYRTGAGPTRGEPRSLRQKRPPPAIPVPPGAPVLRRWPGSD